MALEEEHDVFFADLSKQISLLIMDDEEELQVQFPQLPRQVSSLSKMFILAKREVRLIAGVSLLPPDCHSTVLQKGEQRNWSLHPTGYCTKKDGRIKEADSS